MWKNAWARWGSFSQPRGAVARSGGRNGQAADDRKLAVIRRALEIVAEQKPAKERTVALLELFAAG